MTVHLAELGSDLSLVPTPWEPGRCETMCATGRVIYEKAAAGQLLTDLRDASG